MNPTLINKHTFTITSYFIYTVYESASCKQNVFHNNIKAKVIYSITKTLLEQTEKLRNVHSGHLQKLTDSRIFSTLMEIFRAPHRNSLDASPPLNTFISQCVEKVIVRVQEFLQISTQTTRIF